MLDPLVDAVRLGDVTGTADDGRDASLVAEEPGVSSKGHADRRRDSARDTRDAVLHEFGERVLRAHFAALAVVVYFYLVVDPPEPGGVYPLPQTGNGFVEARTRQQTPVEANSSLFGDYIDGAAAVERADVRRRCPQQGVLDFAVVGGVQCEHDLSRMLDGRYALPRAAAVTRAALYQDLTLQETPLGDRYGE